MNRCEWCGKAAEKLNSITDEYGDKYNICSSCEVSNRNHECIKCGNLITFGIKGMCTTCYQVKMNDLERRKEEALNGVPETSALSFTDEEYEQWLTMGNAYSPADIQKSRELRRIWIIVKLGAAGITDAELISENFKDIEVLLNRCFTKLIHNKCRLLLSVDDTSRKAIKAGNIIDSEKSVYIIEA